MEKSKHILLNLEKFNEEEQNDEDVSKRKSSFKANDSDSEDEGLQIDKTRKEKGN